MEGKAKLFETERLILRRLEFSDAEEMYNNYCNNDNVTKYLTWATHRSVEDTKEYLEKVALPRYDTENPYMWALVLKETNQVIGCIDACYIDLRHKRAEIGWVLSEKYWGKGLMPEAGLVIRDYLFSEGFERIQAKHDVRNPKSGRAMQKIGMTHEGTLKKYEFDNNGNLVDYEFYAIVKDEQ